MDTTIIDFLLNSNPISASAVLSCVVLFFYNIIRKHEKTTRHLIEDQHNINNKNLDEVSKLLDQLDGISNDISDNVKALNLQLNGIQDKLRKIETSDVDNKLELLYLKKDIESIKKCMEFQYLKSIQIRDDL